MLKMFIRPKKNPQTGEFLYYGQLAPVSPLMLSDITQNISAECTVTPHDVKAVLSAFEEQIYRALRDGCSVRFGDLGSFHPTVSTKGVDSPELFRKGHVKVVRCRFSPSAKLRFELSTKNPNMHIQVDSPEETAQGSAEQNG